MKNNAAETADTLERLIRVRAARRGTPVELRVHFERSVNNGCQMYKIFCVEDAELSTSTN